MARKYVYKIATSTRRVTESHSIKKGDFVSYNTYDDGKSYNGYIPEYVWAKVIDVAADGKLTLATYDYEFHDEIDEVDPSRCRKLDHFGGMKNEREYYTGGKINIYAGYYEYILTEKELSKPYVFCGTIDTLDEHDEVECYNDESVYVDKDLEKSWDGLGIEFVDLSDKDYVISNNAGELGEKNCKSSMQKKKESLAHIKKTEARRRLSVSLIEPYGHARYADMVLAKEEIEKFFEEHSLYGLCLSLKTGPRINPSMELYTDACNAYAAEYYFRGFASLYRKWYRDYLCDKYKGMSWLPSNNLDKAISEAWN